MPFTPLQPQVAAIAGSGSIQVGIVLAAQEGSRMMDVRIEQTNRAIRHVLAAAGTTFQAGDRVVIMHTDYGEHRWVAITKLLSDDNARDSSSVAKANVMHPPSGFVVEAVGSIVVAEWEAWPGKASCFQVQHNSSASEVGAIEFFTRGSYYLYRTSVATTRHFRVRAFEYNVEYKESYASAWTVWASAMSLASATSVEIESAKSALIEFMLDQDIAWTMHLVAERELL